MTQSLRLILLQASILSAVGVGLLAASPVAHHLWRTGGGGGYDLGERAGAQRVSSVHQKHVFPGRLSGRHAQLLQAHAQVGVLNVDGLDLSGHLNELGGKVQGQDVDHAQWVGGIGRLGEHLKGHVELVSRVTEDRAVPPHQACHVTALWGVGEQ